MLWLAGVVLALVTAGTTEASTERFSSTSGEVSCEMVDPGDGSSAPGDMHHDRGRSRLRRIRRTLPGRVLDGGDHVDGVGTGGAL
nr:hypothetical protein [Prescottella equi]